MEKLRVKLLAFPAADIKVFTKAKRRLQKLFRQDMVEFVDKDPEVLVFLTGGSERIALQSVQEFGFYLLIASNIDNSWAAATEVKAWMNQNNIASMLVDQNSGMAIELVDHLHKVKNGIKRLKGKRFGLVGEASDWLVNSSVDPFVIKTKLGIDQVNIPWSSVEINDYREVSADFLNFFNTQGIEGLTGSGRVYEALSDLIRKYELHALTVECFPLIQKSNVTACLALSKLSMDGIPAGCEGDNCSMLGMMIAKELFGIVPWIANTSFVDPVKKQITFSHCTAPANLLKDFEFDTHFESGKGLAIKGNLKADKVTIVRFDHTLSKMFVGEGFVECSENKNRKGMCRTQLLVNVKDSTINYFLNEPLGNHHLVIPADFTLGFELAARMLKMALV
jgi:L-fucose isomerase-like protein